MKFKNDLNNHDKLKLELDKIINENKKLKNALLKANKIISNIENNNINNNELKMIKEEKMNLKYQLLQKDNEILNLKNQLLQNNNMKNPEMFNMIVYFQSQDQEINNVAIKCLSSDTFAEIEEKVYKKFPNFRNTNNTPICNGRIILRFKTLSENNIKDENIVQLIKIE